MSKTKKLLVVRIIFGVLVALVLVLGSLTVVSYNKNNRLNDQIDNLKELNESLTDTAVENFVILTLVDVDKEGAITAVKPYFVDKTLDMSIYAFLLTTPDFKDEDFATYDNSNYYFNSTQDGVYLKTDVLELQDNASYYDQEWGSLVVGLQAVKITNNYTVVRGIW